MQVKIKVVPGASRDEVAGWLGDRLKVRVSAPPEGGRANKAVVSVLAEGLGIDRRCIRIVCGTASANKTLAIEGFSMEGLRRVFGGG